MKRRLMSFAMTTTISAFVSLVAGCGSGKARVFDGSDRTAITLLLTQQQEAWNRGDIESFMQGYVRSKQLVFTSGSEIRRGWQETYERYRKRYGKDASTMGRLSFEVLELQPLGADGAVVLGRWRLSDLDAPLGGVFSVVLERRPEGWRIVHDHTSADPKKKSDTAVDLGS